MKQKFKNLFGKSKQRALVLACATIAYNTMTYAQGHAGAAGVGAINGAANAFKSYLTPVQNLLYAIAGIIALVGCFTIFAKLQNGDQASCRWLRSLCCYGSSSTSILQVSYSFL